MVYIEITSYESACVHTICQNVLSVQLSGCGLRGKDTSNQHCKCHGNNLLAVRSECFFYMCLYSQLLQSLQFQAVVSSLCPTTSHQKGFNSLPLPGMLCQ